MSNVDNKLYPEVSAGGYCRCDHRMEYIVRVNALLNAEMALLEYGAGHGKWQNDHVILRRNLGNFVGRCAKVVACDVDPAVQRNPQADMRHLAWAERPPASGRRQLRHHIGLFCIRARRRPRISGGRTEPGAKTGGVDLRLDAKQMGVCRNRRPVGAEALAQSCAELG